MNLFRNQELLMVSVLPAHVALEMKSEMLRKVRKAQMKSMFIDNELNVSISKDSTKKFLSNTVSHAKNHCLF